MFVILEDIDAHMFTQTRIYTFLAYTRSKPCLQGTPQYPIENVLT